MQALSRCLAAASQQQQQQQGKAEAGGALGLVQQLMFNLAKKGMTAANLAVRQVSVTRLDFWIYPSIMQQCYLPHMLGTAYTPACDQLQQAFAWQVDVENGPAETSHQPGSCRKQVLDVNFCSNANIRLVSRVT